MAIDIDKAGKAVGSIASAVASVLPIIRDWRARRESKPDELKTVADAFDTIQNGLDGQKQIAYVFRPLIDNYGHASELLSLIDKLKEFGQENEAFLHQESDVGKNLRQAMTQMIEDIGRYDIILLKRIIDDSFHFLRDKDKAILKKAANSATSELRAIESITARESWDLELLSSHLTAMSRSALDLKTELITNLGLLVDVLAFVRLT